MMVGEYIYLNHNKMEADNTTYGFEIRHFIQCPHCSKNTEVVTGCYEAFCENCNNNFEYNIDKIAK